MIKTLFFLTLLFLPGISLYAEEWVINKDHSEIFFKVPYLKVSEVTGRFAEFKGSVIMDGSSIEEMDIVIKVSSLSTENSLRDSHLKAPDFLNTAVYPEIIFIAKDVKASGNGQYRANGNLTLHGKTRPQTINFRLSDSLDDSWGYKNRFVKFDFQIRREDFNLKWNKTLAENKYLVGETVTINGNIQLQPLHSLTPASKHFIPVTSFTRGKEKLSRGEISQEEFKKLYLPEGKEVSAAEEKVVQPAAPSLPVVKEAPSVSNLDFRNSFAWWTAFLTLGLLGFFAAIIVGLFAKNKVLELFPQKYREEGMLGHLSDLMVIGFTLIYSMAFWYVGWGH